MREMIMNRCNARTAALRLACPRIMLIATISANVAAAPAEIFNVGPDQPYNDPNAVPWESLTAGDIVNIHWRNTPYRCKWVIAAEGTEQNPVVIRGIPNNDGTLPVIDGEDATTRLDLDFWNENRSVIKVGGSSIPADNRPTWITIENLDVRGAHPDYTFSNDGGSTEEYAPNAAAIHIQRGDHVTIRNCVIRDSGNGIFIGSYDWQSTEHVLIEGCHIHSNGIVGSIYQHNTYTEALGITYQFNRFGALKEGAGGNNLKDRSAGLVVAYNWIEDGNRQLDLVEASDRPLLINDPSYRETHVYGNIIVESEGVGNSQIIHYGGDSGNTDDYRKGTLFLHHNTIVSTRSGNTTIVRLSSDEEHADIRNNILYTTSTGTHLAILNGDGTADLSTNWLNSGWVPAHSGNGTVNDDGTQITGSTPGFRELSEQDFTPVRKSAVVDAAAPPHEQTAAPDHAYQRHQRSIIRPAIDDALDLGAIEAHDNADINADGNVNVDDLVALLGAWGPCPQPPAPCADINNDGIVGVKDLLLVIAQWS